MPTDHKAHYEKKMVNGFPCLIVRAAEKPARRAILFFFGGGMVIGPDKGDAAVLRKLRYGTDSDVWFPIYPLCTEHCITESYDMAYGVLPSNDRAVRRREREHLRLFLWRGARNGHGRAQQRTGPAPPAAEAHHHRRPRRGAVERRGTRTDAGRSMRVTLPSTMAFMAKGEELMRHGHNDVPDYMLAPSRGDYTGVGDNHFYYSTDEVLYGALPEFKAACERANVPYTVTARPGMTHCYCMLPYFKEAKEDFAMIVEQLKK